MASGRILILDDDPSISAIFEALFLKEGYRIHTAHSIAEMGEVLQAFSFDAVLVDLMLGAENGMDAIPLILREAPFTRIFILSGHGSIDLAVQALRSGASGFLEKSTNPAEIVRSVMTTLEHQPGSSGPSDASTSCASNYGIIGRSAATKELLDTIWRLREIDSTVLILGDSGSGKELVARALHTSSNRAHQRFEAINCAAIPENLLEAELFGVKRGAFTDAKADRVGIFQICSEGTLFLDEIGEMPIALQSKMLRVLQERQVTPVGSNTPVKINTRIVAATNRNLKDAITAGRFREDLYFRLSVIMLSLRPLRERIEDIPLLISLFLKQFNQRFSRQIKEPNQEVLARLMAYPWPGNVRELQNALERGVALSRDDQLSLADMFFGMRTEPSSNGAAASPHDSLASVPQGLDLAVFEMPLTDAKQHFEKSYVQRMLARTGGNIAESARRSGRYRADIYRLISKYHLPHNLRQSTL